MAKYLITEDEWQLIREECKTWNAKKVPRHSNTEPECSVCGNKRWIMVLDGSRCTGKSMLSCECQEKMKVFGYRRHWGGVRRYF